MKSYLWTGLALLLSLAVAVGISGCGGGGGAGALPGGDTRTITVTVNPNTAVSPGTQVVITAIVTYPNTNTVYATSEGGNGNPPFQPEPLYLSNTGGATWTRNTSAASDANGTYAIQVYAITAEGVQGPGLASLEVAGSGGNGGGGEGPPPPPW